MTGILRMGSFVMRAAPQFWQRVSADRQRSILPAPFRPNPELWPATGLHAAWLGHSTVLLKIDGVTILTDPVFSDRIGIGLGPVTLGLKRLVYPALPLASVPRPDIVLLSHAHFDHWDIPSLRTLESPATKVVTASKTSDLLRVRRYGAVSELAWGETVRLGDLTFRGLEVRHWGARVQRDTWRGYNGYLIESPRYRVLFAGDTAMTDAFRALRSSRPIDLAIMPIGAYDPWVHAHCNPEEALAMANHAGADVILPVHHRTFQLSREGYNDPIERLSTALSSAPDRLALGEIGQEYRHS
jgi:L-ascorbate metabolism protein UlaG (beta-lactamase superfamily)